MPKDDIKRIVLSGGSNVRLIEEFIKRISKEKGTVKVKEGSTERRTTLLKEIVEGAKRANKTPAKYILEDLLNPQNYSEEQRREVEGLRISIYNYLVETGQIDLEWEDVKRYLSGIQNNKELMELCKIFPFLTKIDRAEMLAEFDTVHFGSREMNYRMESALGPYLGNIRRSFPGFSGYYFGNQSDLRLSLANCLEKFNEEMFKKSEKLRNVLFNSAKRNYLKPFDKKPIEAQAELEKQIAESASFVKKTVLQKTLDYYKEVMAYTIKGMSTTIIDRTDPEKKRILPFPSIHQNIGIKFAVDKVRSLNADEQGTGKTAIAVGTFLKLQELFGNESTRALIVCSGDYSLGQWADRIAEYTNEYENAYGRKLKVIAITSKNKIEAIEEAKGKPVEDFNGQLAKILKETQEDLQAARVAANEAVTGYMSGIADGIEHGEQIKELKTLVSATDDFIKRARQLFSEDEETLDAINGVWYSAVARFAKERLAQAEQKKDEKEKELWNGLLKEVEDARSADVVLISYDMVFRSLGIDGEDSGFTKREADRIIKHLSEIRFKLLVPDECHNVKNHLALRSIAVRSLAFDIERLLLMSGTPNPNKTIDLAHEIVMINQAILPDIKRRVREELTRSGNIHNERRKVIRNLLVGYIQSKMYRELASKDTEHALRQEKKSEELLSELRSKIMEDIAQRRIVENLGVTVADAGHILESAWVTVKKKVIDSGILDEIRSGATVKLSRKCEIPTPEIVDAALDKLIEDKAMSKIAGAFDIGTDMEDAGRIRTVLKDCMIRRRSAEVQDLKPLRINHKRVRLTREEAEAYLDERAKKATPLEKMIELRRIAICQAKHDYIAKVATLRAIKGRMPQQRKTIVFSSVLKEGILDKLEKRLQAEGLKVARIDGEIISLDGKIIPANRKNAKSQAVDFFKDPQGADVLIATLETMGESVDDLIVSNRLIYPDLHLSPGKFFQGVKRPHRQGQELPVRVTVLYADGTIDDGHFVVMNEKKRIGDFILDGIGLYESEHELYDSDNGDNSVLVAYTRTPAQNLHFLHGEVVNRGSETNHAKLGMIINDYARDYCYKLDSSYQMNVGRVLAQLISGMERSGRRFKNIIDVASGPCMLSVATKRSTTAVDMFQELLDKGGRICDSMGVQTRRIKGFAHELQKAVGAEKFGMSVLSLALHWGKDESENADGERTREREAMIRNLNFVTDMGGYAVISIPETKISELGEKLLWEGIEKLGFRVIKGLSGLVVAEEDPRFGAHVTVAQKFGHVRLDEQLDKNYFMLNEDDSQSIAQKRMKTIKGDEIDSVACSDFAFCDRETGEKKTITESVRKALGVLQPKAGGNGNGDEKSAEEAMRTGLAEGRKDFVVFMYTSDTRAYSELLKLAKKHGSIGKIPDSELKKAGYVWEQGNGRHKLVPMGWDSPANKKKKMRSTFEIVRE